MRAFWTSLAGLVLTAVAVASYAAGVDQGEKRTSTPVFELRTYTAAPGKMDALNACFREHTGKLTLVAYEGRMYANKKQRIATYYDKVVVINLPTDDPNLPIDVSHLPPGYLYMSCEELEVKKSQFPDGRTYQKMRASKRVAIETQEFSGNADVVKYDESKEQVILEGNDGNLALLKRQKVRGTEGDEVRGRKIIYLRATGEYKVEDAQSIRVAQ